MEDIRKELEIQLKQAATDGNEVNQEELFQTIISKSNELRRKYGLPEYEGDFKSQHVLKYPSAVFQAAQVGNERALGWSIHSKISSTIKQEPKITIFNQSFASPGLAKEYLGYAERADPFDSSVILPPLLVRSTINKTLHLKVTTEGAVRHKKPNLVLVFFKSGPIIPIVDQAAVGEYGLKNVLKVLYEAQGFVDARGVEEMLEKEK